jgi:hypothetical protein
MRIQRLWIWDEVDRLHAKIDTLNVLLVRFCFIRSIDTNKKTILRDMKQTLQYQNMTHLCSVFSRSNMKQFHNTTWFIWTLPFSVIFLNSDYNYQAEIVWLQSFMTCSTTLGWTEPGDTPDSPKILLNKARPWATELSDLESSELHTFQVTRSILSLLKNGRNLWSWGIGIRKVID